MRRAVFRFCQGLAKTALFCQTLAKFVSLLPDVSRSRKNGRFFLISHKNFYQEKRKNRPGNTRAVRPLPPGPRHFFFAGAFFAAFFAGFFAAFFGFGSGMSITRSTAPSISSRSVPTALGMRLVKIIAAMTNGL